ncbi:MAG: hypothetical protein BGO06_23350 [Shinella sp. 65-6]|nr:MAG: hypothetical protein BGO06_23350 [Shinella sp. 65-6]
MIVEMRDTVPRHPSGEDHGFGEIDQVVEMSLHAARGGLPCQPQAMQIAQRVFQRGKMRPEKRQGA